MRRIRINYVNKICRTAQPQKQQTPLLSIKRFFAAAAAAPAVATNGCDSALTATRHPLSQQQHIAIASTAASDSSKKRQNNRSWKDPRDHRRLFDTIAKDLGISCLDDWYTIGPAWQIKQRFRELHSLLSSYYMGSMYDALCAVYPEHEWIPWKFPNVPHGFWLSAANTRRFFDHLARKELNLQTLDDWYEVKRESVKNKIPSRVWALHNNSLPRALMFAYPDHKWDDAKFKYFSTRARNPTTTSTTATASMDHHHGATTTAVPTFEQLAAANQITAPEDWRKVQVPARFWDNTRNQRLFFDQLAESLGVKQLPDGWYNLNKGTNVASKIPSGILNRYGYSWRRALQRLYPEYSWAVDFVNPNIANKVSVRWQQRTGRAEKEELEAAVDVSQHRAAFEHLAQQLDVQRWPEDWYGVTRQQVLQHGTVYRYLLSTRLYGSLYNALSTIYPEHKWLPWRFRSGAPSGFWSSTNGRRLLFDHIAEEIGVRQLDEWYNVDHAVVAAMVPGGLLRRYGSWQRALMDTYRDHNWDLPALYRTSSEAIARKQQALPSFESVLHENSIQVPADWARCKRTLPGHFWTRENQREYFDWLGRHLGILQPSDWYDIDPRQAQVPAGILIQHGYSLVQALKATYPEHRLQVWRFKHCRTPSGAGWADQDTLRDYVAYLAEELCISDDDLDEWYRVSMEQIERIGGASLILRNGGLFKLLRRVYPNHPWQANRFVSSSGKRSAQRWLRIQVKRLFPDITDIQEEYRIPSQPLLSSSDTASTADSNTGTPIPTTPSTMRLDIYVPSLSLAFEYHGEQHYMDVHFFAPQHEISSRDEEKKAACERAGITLVVVPYWWDTMAESLAATIAQARPDLLPRLVGSVGSVVTTSDPIPLILPASATQRCDDNSTNDNNNLTSATATAAAANAESAPDSAKQRREMMMLAGQWDESEDPTGWWMSEKLDGVRAYWDGHKLYSRHGIEINAPPSFTSALPRHISLDGELWLGRGTIGHIISVINSPNNDNSHHQCSGIGVGWHCVRYCVFDSPSLTGGYEERVQLLLSMKKNAGSAEIVSKEGLDNDSTSPAPPPSPSPSVLPRHVDVIPITRCEGPDHLLQSLREIVSQGGEGIMLRRPNSKYEPGTRSSAMLKVKLKQDSEVRFIRHAKYGLLCEMPTGQHIIVRCDFQTLSLPLQPGAVLTVTHYGNWKTSGKLRYPMFLRERKDMSWEDVLRSSSSSSSK